MNIERKIQIGALLGYGLIALILWFSVIMALPENIPGTGGDPIQTLWRMVRMEQSIPEGNIVVPEEASFPNLAPLPWIPLTYLFNEQIAYTVAWFVAAILAGWFMFQAARSLGASPGISFLAGLLVMLSPYRLAHSLGHFGAMQIWLLPAVLYVCTRFIQTRRVVWGVAFAIAAIGVIWTEHHLFVALMIICAVIGAFYHNTLLLLLRQRPFVTIGIFLMILVIGIGPFATAVMQTATPDSSFNPGNEQRERYSATPASLFTLAPFLLVRGGAPDDYHKDQRAVADHLHTIGIVLPIITFLLVIGAIRDKKRRRLTLSLLAVAGIGILIALGPKINIGGVSIPLPGSLFEYMPILSAMRTLGRFIGLTVVTLPLILAIHWNNITLRWIKVGLAVFLLLEVLPTFGYPTVSVPDTNTADAIKTLPKGTILSIPGHTDYEAASRDLYLSAHHDKELIGNSALARVFPINDPYVMKTPVVSDLLTLRVDNLFTETLFSQQPEYIAYAAFRSQDISGIVLDTYMLDGAVAERIRVFLRDTLYIPEQPIRSGIFMYDVTTIPSKHIGFAIPGEGFTPDRTGDGLVMSVRDGAKIHIYSSKKESVEAYLVLPDINTIEFTDVPQGFSTHTVRVSADEILVQQPQFIIGTND